MSLSIFCSTSSEIGTGTTKRHVGSKKKEFKCPLALTQHQRHMFGVDQIRAQGGGFSDHVHFKKWHKKVHCSRVDGPTRNKLHICSPLLHSRQESFPKCSSRQNAFCAKMQSMSKGCLAFLLLGLNDSARLLFLRKGINEIWIRASLKRVGSSF